MCALIGGAFDSGQGSVLFLQGQLEGFSELVSLLAREFLVGDEGFEVDLTGDLISTNEREK